MQLVVPAVAMVRLTLHLLTGTVAQVSQVTGVVYVPMVAITATLLATISETVVVAEITFACARLTQVVA